MQRQNDVTQRIDAFALVCIALIALSWFGMNTLLVSFGHFTQGTRFYEMGVVLLHPAALFIGIGNDHAVVLTTVILLAMAALLVALAAPLVSSQPRAWLTGWLPLMLMLTCFAVLYGNGSGAQLDAAAAGSSIQDDLMRLANHMMQRAQNALVAHIGIGSGGVLSLLAALALGIRSTMNYLAISDFSSESSRKLDPFSREPASS
jgi:hypothetical protein